MFLFDGTATTEISTLSLHDALPISSERSARRQASPALSSRVPRKWWKRSCSGREPISTLPPRPRCSRPRSRSEEHTSELQSHVNLVCRLLLEKKKDHRIRPISQKP